MAANTGLYYPYIQFKSDAWLKLTALYWDNMARIVPDRFPLADSDDVKKLVYEDGYVLQRSPKPLELEAVGRSFEALINLHGDALAQRYSLDHEGEWPIDKVTAMTEPQGNPRLGYVYPTKLTPTLDSALRTARLAEYGPSHPDVGLGMHPRLADVYMLTLARVIAKSSGYEPVTDETRNHIGVAACTVEELVAALLGPVEVARPSGGAAGAEATLVNLAFEAVIPEGLEDVPIDTILKIRKAWEEERVRFRNGIKDIVQGLGNLVDITDREALNHHLRAEYKEKVGRPFDKLKKDLDRAQIKTVVGAFSLATVLPAGTIGAVLAAGAAAAVPWFVGAVAIALGAYKLLSDHREKIEGLMDTPPAYLVCLEKDLEAARLGQLLDADMQRFALSAP
jgi:hypothetical protein